MSILSERAEQLLEEALACPSDPARWRVAADAAEIAEWSTAPVLRAVAAMADLGDDQCVVVYRMPIWHQRNGAPGSRAVSFDLETRGHTFEVWRKTVQSSHFLFSLRDFVPDEAIFWKIHARTYPSEYGPVRGYGPTNWHDPSIQDLRDLQLLTNSIYGKIQDLRGLQLLTNSQPANRKKS